MNNIFKDAKFGARFRTRDGRMAIYQQSYGDWHTIMLKDEDEFIDYYSNGDVIYEYSENTKRQEQDDDIIGKWEESIDEEKLDRLAEEEYPYEYETSPYGYEEAEYKNELRDAFKKGMKRILERL